MGYFKSISLDSWPYTLGAVDVPWVHHRVLRGAVTHRGAACGSADMPRDLLTRGIVADRFLWACGEEIRVTQMGKVCKPEVDTRALVLLCLCFGCRHQLVSACMGDTNMSNRAGLCVV